MRKPDGYIFANDRSGQLFNYLREKYKLEDDTQLSKRIGIARPIISRVRTAKQPLSGNHLIKINEKTGVTIKKMRELIGDQA